MRKFTLLIILVLSTIVGQSQVPLNVTTVNVEGLPPAATNNNKTYQVKSPTRGDCTTAGGGSAFTWCKSNGSAWVPVGDGGTGATGSVNSVGADPPLSSTGGSDPVISVVQDSSHRFATDAEKSTWNGKQAGDGDLSAIAALSGTGFAKRTGADTWSLTAGVASGVTNKFIPRSNGTDFEDSRIYDDVGGDGIVLLQGTDDVLFGATGQFTIGTGGFITKYGNSAPTNGQVLIGNTANGRFEKGSLTAGSNITITPGTGGITISSTAGGVTNSAGANVLPKSDGANLIASRITDNGTDIVVGTNELSAGLGDASFILSDSSLLANLEATTLGLGRGNVRLELKSATDRIEFGNGLVLSLPVSGNVTLETGASDSLTFDTNGGNLNFAGGGDIDLGTSTIGAGVWAATPIGIAFGGTGVALVDPNADRLLFWDDSVGVMAFLTAGTGLSISGTTISSTAPTNSAGNNVVPKSNGINLVPSTMTDDGTTVTFSGSAHILSSLDVDGDIDVGAIVSGNWNGNVIALAYGGLGVSLVDPNADRILFWDDSVGAMAFLTLGTGLSITGTTINGTAAGVTNSAGNNVIPKSNGTNLVASSITDDGTDVVVNADNFSAVDVSFNSLNVAANLNVEDQISGTNLALNGATSGTINITPAAVAGIWTFTLPVNDGNAGQFLQTDGSGVTSWVDATGGVPLTDGDKGDITVSSSGAAWVIDGGAVSLSKMADVATASVFYRKTAGTGSPEVQTLGTLKADLGLTGTNSGDQTSVTGNAGTATALQNARTIGGVNFNGTANIVPATITVADTTDSTSFVALFESATGDLAPKTDAGLAYNASSGNFGIGITPAVRLHVSGANDSTSRIRLDNTGDNVSMQIEAGVGEALFNVERVVASGAYSTFSIATSATRRLTVAVDGGVTLGAPTGGSKGAGTLNASAVYDDNVLLTDWVFDAGHKPTESKRLYSLDTVRQYTISERRLPWMPTPTEFENARHLGGMTTRLWQGQEQQQLYIFQLEDRIKKLEQQSEQNHERKK